MLKRILKLLTNSFSPKTKLINSSSLKKFGEIIEEDNLIIIKTDKGLISLKENKNGKVIINIENKQFICNPENVMEFLNFFLSENRETNCLDLDGIINELFEAKKKELKTNNPKPFIKVLEKFNSVGKQILKECKKPKDKDYF
jgi:hypothetical protein